MVRCKAGGVKQGAFEGFQWRSDARFPVRRISYVHLENRSEWGKTEGEEASQEMPRPPHRYRAGRGGPERELATSAGQGPGSSPNPTTT